MITISNATRGAVQRIFVLISSTAMRRVPVTRTVTKVHVVQRAIVLMMLSVLVTRSLVTLVMEILSA